MALYSNGPFKGSQHDLAIGAVGIDVGSPEENCHSIIVYNTDAADTVFLAWDGVGVDIRPNSVRIPPQTSMTIPIGNLSNRVNGGDINGALGKLSMQHNDGASTVTVYITYIFGLES